METPSFSAEFDDCRDHLFPALNSDEAYFPGKGIASTVLAIPRSFARVAGGQGYFCSGTNMAGYRSTLLAALILISLFLSGTVASVAQRGSCNIKGNVSTKGERIYHVPGQKYYGDTRINRPMANDGSAPKRKPAPRAGDDRRFEPSKGPTKI